MGEQREGRAKPAATSGFNCDLGEGSLEELVDLATNFLMLHAEDLKRISNIADVESCYVDFAYDCRLDDQSAIIQRDYFPAKFVSVAGEIGLGLCLTLCSA